MSWAFKILEHLGVREVIWCFLVLQSLWAVSLFFSGFSFYLRMKRNLSASEQNLVFLSSKFSTAEKPGMPTSIDLRTLKRNDSIIDQLARFIIEKEPSLEGAYLKARSIYDLLDAGRVRVGGILARTATLTGLAGTLVGVQEALKVYAGSPSGNSGIIAGFETALTTTLFGVMTALTAVAATRFLIEQRLEQAKSLMDSLLLHYSTYLKEKNKGGKNERIKDSPRPGNFRGMGRSDQHDRHNNVDNACSNDHPNALHGSNDAFAGIVRQGRFSKLEGYDGFVV